MSKIVKLVYGWGFGFGMFFQSYTAVIDSGWISVTVSNSQLDIGAKVFGLVGSKFVLLKDKLDLFVLAKPAFQYTFTNFSQGGTFHTVAGSIAAEGRLIAYF